MLKDFLKELIKEKKINGSFISFLKKRHKLIYQKIIIQTDYLSTACKFTERIYHIINELKEKPKCSCGNYLKFRRYYTGYHNHCFFRCSSLDKIVKEKNKQTCLKKYKTENPFQAKEIKEKMTKTKLEKYGDKNYTNRGKAKQTCLKKHGVEYNFQIKDFQNKVKKLKYKKYGDENYYNIEKAQKTSLEKYGTENPAYNEKIKQKIKKTKLERFGDENYCNVDKIMDTKFKNGIFGYQGYKGNYQGFYYDSTWELSFIKYCLKNNIQIERNKKGFVYWYQDKKHKYYPDFYLPEVDLFIEVKGYMREPEKELEKWKQFPYKLDIYNKKKLINNNMINRGGDIII